MCGKSLSRQYFDAMVRRLTLGVLCTLAAVAALPATGVHAEPAAECAWLSTDLPLPSGFVNGLVSGSDGGDTFAGVVWNNSASHHGVVWERTGCPACSAR